MPNCRIPRTATPEKAWCVTAGSDRRRRTGKADDDADRWEEQVAVARPTASRSSWPGRSAKRVVARDVPAIHVFASRKTWMPGTRPRLSGTVCAFMPPSPLRHKPDLQDAVARFASRLVRGRTLSVAQDLEVAISGEVQRSRADASGLLE